MGFVQRLQFTASPTWIAQGNFSGEPQLGIAFGSCRMKLEGSVDDGSGPQGVKVELAVAPTTSMFPDLDPVKEYRVTIEEVTP